jgi:peptidoglycan hydrolase-like protein with peptidoglycan-binding domain
MPAATPPVKIVAPAAFVQPALVVPSSAPIEPGVVKAALTVPVPKAVESIQPPLEGATPDAELTWAEVLELQRRLVSLGINPGPLDGVIGPRTMAGIQRYQELKGIAASGKVDRQTLKLLQQDPGASVTLEARAP